MVGKGLIGGSYKPLSEDAISKVHQTAMRIIEEVGFEVNSEEALNHFKKAGAWTSRGTTVRACHSERRWS